MTTHTVTAITQFDRISAFCRQALPQCEVLLLSDPESAFLRFSVHSLSKLVYESHAISISDLATMSDEELWELLAHLSHRLIRRPAT